MTSRSVRCFEGFPGRGPSPSADPDIYRTRIGRQHRFGCEPGLRTRNRFSVSPDCRDLIRLERHKVLLLLRSHCNDGAEACVREQVLCLYRMSAANKEG